MMLDSIASNACAHYIHNMLFLLGKSMDESAEVEDVEGVCLRANSIESFDTCTLKMKVSGADLYIAASHAAEKERWPEFVYKFENATLTYVEDEGGGEYYAVRVEKILPPALPGLDEVRAPLTRYFLMRETAKLMEAKANELAARVRKGESVEAVAAAFGAPVSHAIGVDRVNARQNQALSPDLLNKLFGAKAGDVLIGQANPFGFAVGKVDAIQPGPTAQAARIAEAQRPQVTMQLLQEMGERARLAAGQLVKVRTDQNKARSALGVAPIDTKKAKDQPKTPERAG